VAVVELDAAGRVRLDGRALDAAALRAGLKALAASHPGAEVRLRANVGVPYGQVAALIGTVQAAGLSRIGFEAEALPRAR
jgi:biopolymer transport protein ExbD